MPDLDTLASRARTAPPMTRSETIDQLVEIAWQGAVMIYPDITRNAIFDRLIAFEFDRVAGSARRHVVCGVLTCLDRQGAYRRVASNLATTADRVAALCGGR